MQFFHWLVFAHVIRSQLVMKNDGNLTSLAFLDVLTPIEDTHVVPKVYVDQTVHGLRQQLLFLNQTLANLRSVTAWSRSILMVLITGAIRRRRKVGA